MMEREGGCACGKIRYKLTGSAFLVNIWIERRFVEDHSRLSSVMIPAGSGKPHEVFRCPDCGTALWGKYHAAPGDTLLVRAGTLDRPDAVKPDVHIFTRSKVPWFDLPSGVPSFDGFYKIAEFSPAESRERLRRNIAGES